MITESPQFEAKRLLPMSTKQSTFFSTVNEYSSAPLLNKLNNFIVQSELPLISKSELLSCNKQVIQFE